MPAPYSQDLREKAIEAVSSGRKMTEVSQSLRIGYSSLKRWVKQHRETGEVSAKQGYQQGHSHKITDWDAFRAFACEHGEKTQAEMAQLWPEEISEDTIGRGLKHIAFTRKKRVTPTENERPRSAERS